MRSRFMPCIVAAVGVLSLGLFSSSIALAQGTMAPAAKPAAKKMAGPVYVCTPCKEYMTPAMAKKMAYKDPMGHKLVKMNKAPAGYADASKMPKKGMEKM